MITRRKEALEQLEQYKVIFQHIINKPVNIAFDMHRFNNVIITGLNIVKLTDMKNAPDKRITEDGKNKSPLVFEIQTREGNLQFIFDDTIVSQLTDGVRLTLSDETPFEITMRLT